MIDFTKEKEFNSVVDGFSTLDPFGILHIIVDDGNVEDRWIDYFADKELTQAEEEFLRNLKSLPLNMRYFAYDYT